MTGLENLRGSVALDKEIGHCNERRWMLPAFVLVLLHALPCMADADTFVAVASVLVLYSEYFGTGRRLHLTERCPGRAIDTDVSFALFEMWKWKLKPFTTT